MTVRDISPESKAPCADFNVPMAGVVTDDKRIGRAPTIRY
jgi:3-phosphoglycerate kinase